MRSGKTLRTLVSTLANALTTLGPQLVAIALLQPADFGQFSLAYLAFALGSSLMLSLVAEAVDWSRSPVATTNYLEAAAWVALLVAPCAALLALATGSGPLTAALLGTATFFATYRVGARYLEVGTGNIRVATAADLGGALALAVCVALGIAMRTDGPVLVAAAWATSGLAAGVLGRRPRLTGPTLLGRWWHANGARARILLKDSLVLDTSSIGTPYIVAPLLGVAGFGIYRAISNVAAPVRLLLNPLRPLIARRSIDRLLSPALFGAVLGASALAGGAATACLHVLTMIDLDIGVLTATAVYAVPAGLFVAASLAGHYLYLVARSHTDGTTLWRGRLIQSGVALVVPVLGAISRNLDVAIWSYVIATVVGAVTWGALVAHRRGGDA